MIQTFTYLLINFFTVVVCFVASFHNKIKFNRYFSVFLMSSTFVALPFILWDVWFTYIGVWWFNTHYTIGLSVAGLPLEEMLFFYCIPFACLFTYYCLDKFYDLKWMVGFNNLLVYILIVIGVVIAFLHQDKIYTSMTAWVLVGTLIYLHFIARLEWITQATITYLMVTPGFFIVNGILTGTGIESPIVNYNPNEFLGIRILTIPIEDYFYGYSLFLLNVFSFKRTNEIKPNSIIHDAKE